METRARQKWFLREWRKHRGLTQERLADLLGWNKGDVSNLERGARRYNQDQLEALADALRCEPADLIMRDPLQPTPIMAIWESIPETKRDDALRILEALAEAPAPCDTEADANAKRRRRKAN